MSDPELIGGWRLLCSNMLYHAIESRCSSHCVGKKELTFAAERWIKGKVGQVTFEDCCEAMNLDPEVTRQNIRDYLKKPARKPAFKRDIHYASAKKYWKKQREASQSQQLVR